MFANICTPLIVEVANGRWSAYGFNSASKHWNKYLFELLQSRGGVSDSVAEGAYTFNIERTGMLKFEAKLLPVGKI